MQVTRDGAGAPGARGWRDPVRWVLGAMVAGWSVLFIVLGAIRQERFATFSFDLSIYDQAVWLLSRFHDPFVTVRGLEFFGHHVNPIVLLFVPFYWLGAGPLFLLSVQVVVQASARTRSSCSRVTGCTTAGWRWRWRRSCCSTPRTSG